MARGCETTNLVQALAIAAWDAERRPGLASSFGYGVSETAGRERLLALGRRPESGGERAAAADRHVVPEAAFFARRWPTSGQSEEGSLLGCGIYPGAPYGRKRAVRRIPGVTVSVHC
jgi:hypothetical protein